MPTPRLHACTSSLRVIVKVRLTLGTSALIYGYREMGFHTTYFKILGTISSVRPTAKMVWHDYRTGSTMRTMPVKPRQAQPSHRWLNDLQWMRSTITPGKFVVGLLVWILTTSGLQHDPVMADQSSPVGLWYNIDDRTGQPRAEIRIAEQDGVLVGRIERSLSPDPSKEETHCSKCTDDRKGQPLKGMEIMRGVRPANDLWWEGGTILDPDNGKSYSLRLRIADDNRSLMVRGYIGPFFRTQTWYRIQDEGIRSGK